MSWFKVLKLCRKLDDQEGVFTSYDLAEAGVNDPKVASAWLSKFEKWGYVRQDGKQFGGRISWRLTGWGKIKYAPAGSQAKTPAFPEKRRAANPKKGKRRARD